MSMIIGSAVCPRCHNEMLAVTDGFSGDQTCNCGYCGMFQKLHHNNATETTSVKAEQRPDAYISIEDKTGNFEVVALYGRGTYRQIKHWQKVIQANPELYNPKRCRAAIWDKRAKKLRVIFGSDDPMYGNGG